MDLPNTALRHVRAALSKVRRVPLTGALGTTSVYRKGEVAPIPEGTAWWRGIDHAPTPEEWHAVEEAIRTGERARLALAVKAKVGFHDPNYNAALWDAIAIING